MLALPTLAAEPIFTIGQFTVTNSYLNSTLTMVGFVIFAFLINRAVKRYYATDGALDSDASQKAHAAPRGLLNFFEAILEFLYKYLDQVTGSREKSMRFLPIVGTLFFFILVSNWAGLLPGTGSIGFWHGEGEARHLVPLFRPANTDLNMTLAMAILAVAVSHVFGVITIGFFKYANKFIKLGDIWNAVKTLNPMKIVIAFVEFLVGFIEVFSEVAKMVSLSLRLFGNIFAGEVLLTVLGSLIPFFIPLPFMALEILVGLVQAIVFSMLTLVYLSIATAEVHAHDDAGHDQPHKKEHLEPTPTM